MQDSIAPEGIFYDAHKGISKTEEPYLSGYNKAEFRNAIYGTAEAVPFRDRVLTQTLTAPTRRGIKPLVGDTLVGGLR
jgi:hypothetical protein